MPRKKKKGFPFVPIEVFTIKDADYVACNPTQRGTWVSLMAQCAVQGTDGRLENCRSWGDRMWQQVCQVTLAEVNTPSTLWWWEGDDIVVNFWPYDVYENLQAKRERDAEYQRTLRNKNKGGGAPAGQADVSTDVRNDIAPKGSEGKVSKGKASEEKGSVVNPQSGDNNNELLPENRGQNLSRIPLTEEELRILASNLQIDPEYALGRWLLLKSRDWKNAHGGPIADFGEYLLVGWGWEQRRRRNDFVDSAASEERIAEIQEIIKRMPRPNPDVLPDQFQQYMAKRTALEEEAALLKSKIKKFK